MCSGWMQQTAGHYGQTLSHCCFWAFHRTCWQSENICSYEIMQVFTRGSGPVKCPTQASVGRRAGLNTSSGTWKLQWELLASFPGVDIRRVQHIKPAPAHYSPIYFAIILTVPVLTWTWCLHKDWNPSDKRFLLSCSHEMKSSGSGVWCILLPRQIFFLFWCTSDWGVYMKHFYSVWAFKPIITTILGSV